MRTRFIQGRRADTLGLFGGWNNLRDISNIEEGLQKDLEQIQPVGSDLRILSHHQDLVEKQINGWPKRGHQFKCACIGSRPYRIPNFRLNRPHSSCERAFFVAFEKGQINRLRFSRDLKSRLRQDVLDALKPLSDSFEVSTTANGCNGT